MIGISFWLFYAYMFYVYIYMLLLILYWFPFFSLWNTMFLYGTLGQILKPMHKTRFSPKARFSKMTKSKTRNRLEKNTRGKGRYPWRCVTLQGTRLTLSTILCSRPWKPDPCEIFALAEMQVPRNNAEENGPDSAAY